MSLEPEDIFEERGVLALTNRFDDALSPARHISLVRTTRGVRRFVPIEIQPIEMRPGFFHEIRQPAHAFAGRIDDDRRKLAMPRPPSQLFVKPIRLARPSEILAGARSTHEHQRLRGLQRREMVTRPIGNAGRGAIVISRDTTGLAACVRVRDAV